jgi:PHP family Zn ribbon phosphoesterase
MDSESKKKDKDKSKMQWYRMDLHLHTPASSDYAEANVTFLDILQKAESKGLDIISFTDHNSVAGYARMQNEIEELALLERLDRLRPAERKRLDEYRRLLNRVLVLPGFEFTATLGFHVLAVFSPDTTVRELEHVLLRLNVPPEDLDSGSTLVGATTDVLTGYRVIDEAGGLVIGAHVNSAHGIAMQGFDFGGQTKIAYTQDRHLHALEVTDLESGRRRTTASFYNGSKPEYPRRMFCIQGSDAHRLNRDPNDKNLTGIGDRVTEVLLPEPTFQALRVLFLGNDFARTRPFRPTAKAPFDHVRQAREQGPSIVQSFHERATRGGGRLHAVICDIVAFANTNGGTVYIGASPNPKTKAVGVEKPEELIPALKTEIQRTITPPLDVTLDVLDTEDVKVLRVVVPRGSDIPYAVDGSHIFVRQESETSAAVRDEIVNLVKQALAAKAPVQGPPPVATPPPMPAPVPAPPVAPAATPVEAQSQGDQSIFRIPPPRTGVEIVDTVERKGTTYHTMKDLRNVSIVRNVTRSSARRLWRYAITEREQAELNGDKFMWSGDIGYWKTYKWEGKVRYNLAQRDIEGRVHIYYGVTEDGMDGEWRHFLEGETVSDNSD